MIPEFLIAMGLMFDPATGIAEVNDDPTSDAAADWEKLLPADRRAEAARLLNMTDLPDPDEAASVESCVSVDTLSLVTIDVTDDATGLTRVLLATFTDNGRMIEMTAAGTRGGELLAPPVEVRDKAHNESVATVLRISPVSIKVTDAPEGGKNVEVWDVLNLELFDPTTDETETIRLREIHTTYVVGADGRFRRVASRPVPTDIDGLVEAYRVYDDQGRLLDAATLGALLNTLL